MHWHGERERVRTQHDFLATAVKKALAVLNKVKVNSSPSAEGCLFTQPLNALTTSVEGGVSVSGDYYLTCSFASHGIGLYRITLQQMDAILLQGFTTPGPTTQHPPCGTWVGSTLRLGLLLREVVMGSASRASRGPPCRSEHLF